MQKITVIFSVILCLSLLACKKSDQKTVSVVDLLSEKPEEVFKAKNITFKTTEISEMPNYMMGLFGEKIPTEAVRVLVPEYKVDLEKETIDPVVVFESVPLKAPSFVLDKNGKILIVTAEAGNDGAKGEKEGGVFADDDMLHLKTAFSKLWGKETLAKHDFNEGDIYVWKDGKINARLTIENMNFENESHAMRNDVAQDGRHGVLTIYNGVKPEFYDEKGDYFLHPEAQK